MYQDTDWTAVILVLAFICVVVPTIFYGLHRLGVRNKIVFWTAGFSACGALLSLKVFDGDALFELVGFGYVLGLLVGIPLHLWEKRQKQGSA